MNGIKVMHLNDSLDVGGAETMALSLLTGLAELGYRPCMCAMQPGGALAEQFRARSLPVVELDKKAGLDFSLILKLARQLRQQRIRILHTHNYYAWLYGGLASLLVPGCTQVHTQHSHLVMPKSPPDLVKGGLMRIPAKVVAVSEQVLESLLRQRYVSAASDTTVIHNGIDTDRFSCRQATGGTVQIGVVARLAAVKNHTMLIDAFSLMVARGTKAELVIVGDGALRQSLQEQSSRLGVSDRVHFLGERSDVELLLGSFDIFVLPSRSEGLSISLLEAMASSLPVVATAVGGNPVLVKDRYNGFLVEDNDPGALAERLAQLAGDPALRTEMGRNGRTIVAENFSLQRMVASYAEIYQNCLASGSRGGDR